MNKYIVFSVYYKHGEYDVKEYSARDLRTFLITRIVKYLKHNHHFDVGDPATSTGGMIYSKKDPIDLAIVEQKKRYISKLSIDALVKLSLRVDCLSSDSQSDWKIVSICKGRIITGNNLEEDE